MNDFPFENINDLYKRILPALRSKVSELRKNNVSYITEADIWKFLATHVWKKKRDLEFYEMVDSIISLSLEDMDDYLVDKLESKEKENNKEFDSIL